VNLTMLFGQFGQDVRFGLRSLARTPGFGISAMLSLGLGIAATTTIFSVIYGVIIDPFPYAHPETLMSINVQEPTLRFFPYMPEHYLDIAEKNHIFDGVIASTISDVLLTGTSNPERLRGNFVTPNTFGILGVAPYLGRSITPADGAADAAPVAVLGYRFWRTHFGSDSHVLGTNLRLNGKVRTVVGVMPPRFMWRGADVYLPIVFQRGKIVEGVRYINVIGRLKPGVTAAQADADLHPIIQEIFSRDPSSRRQAFHVTLRNFYETYPSSIRKQLWILLGAVSLLLVIACANVSNLMLARAAARSREIAVRASLGAGQLRIARQLLTEGLLLGVASAILGTALAFGMLFAVKSIIPPDTIPDESDVSLNIPVLLVALGVSLLTALLAGIAPAFQAARTDLVRSLRGSGRSLAGSLHEGRLRKALVAAEVALAMVLLIGASLVVRTLLKLSDLDLGFQPSAVLSMQIPLPESRYGTIQTRNQFLSHTLDRIHALPGIEDVALNSFVHPFANWGMQIEVPGSSVRQQRPTVISQISASYPAMLHTPLRQGRYFSNQEVELGRHVALINETLARTYFPKGEAAGRLIRLPELKGEPTKIPNDEFTIVGVVADVRNVGLQQEIYPEVYVPFTTTGYMEAFLHPVLLVTSHGPPQNLANAIQQQIHAIDPDQPVMQVQTVQKLLNDQGLAEPRFSVFLFSVFAGLGLMLCVVGVYGVVNYSISRQMQSFGVRMALGAGRGRIFKLVFGEALRLILTGVIAGGICGLVATRWLSSLIWGVSPSDPLSFAAVMLVLLLAGLGPCVRLAWRASYVNPMIVLRHE
jgi:putative ABC transport system permease protein